MNSSLRGGSANVNRNINNSDATDLTSKTMISLSNRFLHRFTQHVQRTASRYSLSITCTLLVFSPRLVAAAPPPATSIAQAPYSQLFFTGSAYAVKDQDFDPSDPVIGVETVWSRDLKTRRLQVEVAYCIPDNAIKGSPLAKVLLLNQKQSLVAIDQRIGQAVASVSILSPAQYVYPSLSDFEDPNLIEEDPFGNLYANRFSYPFGFRSFPSGYSPEAICSSGRGRFELSQLTQTIAQLPPQTLQMQLVFANGATQTWQLGNKTVQALKDLLQISQNIGQSR